MLFGVQVDGNAGLDTFSIHDNTITGTTSYAIYVWGGGTGLSFQNNMHGESAMSNLLVPGAFSCCTYTRN